MGFRLDEGWGRDPGLFQRPCKEVGARLRFLRLLLDYYLLYHRYLLSDRLQPLLGRGRLLGAWHWLVENGGGRGIQSVDASGFLAGRTDKAGGVPHGSFQLVWRWLLRGVFNSGTPSKDSGDGIRMGRKLDGVGSGEGGGKLRRTGRAFDYFAGWGEVVRL